LTNIEVNAPLTLAEADLRPRGRVYPSPLDWRDQTLYFLLPDRFSDGQEASRPAFDYTQPNQFTTPDQRAWMEGGKVYQGGRLKGIESKLDYLKDLGITAIWIGPIWKQRADLQTYHGYGIQNFLEVEPRFGTRQDLRDLVDAAHDRGIYVLLDIIYNHSGNNWFYDNNDQPWNTMPYRYQPPYPVHSWRSASGQPTTSINTPEDGVWPSEFQNIEWYTRAGSIGSWDAASWENPLHPEVEFRRGDFFDLKDFNLSNDDALNALIRVYQYWIALSDCDGFRIDTVKHISWEASKRFCSAIREYCESIGKEKFLLLGEVTGGEYMARSYLEIFGRNLDAVLDIGPPRERLTSMVKGFGDPRAFFGQFQSHDLLGGHRETGRYHVSILDDHDMVGFPKQRFAAHTDIPARHEQTAHAVGAMLTTLGIPCVYYGTEQALDGNQGRHDFSVEPTLSFEDRYVREAMFGATFGAFGTSSCHFFNPDHPTYLRIAAIARVRNRDDQIGLALRRGRQYYREISQREGDFYFSSGGEIVAWSRVMCDQEVVVALNANGVDGRAAYITVDSTLNPAGKALRVLYLSDWSDDALRTPPENETLIVEQVAGRSAVWVELPPAGMVILA
jgi:glycosidase